MLLFPVLLAAAPAYADAPADTVDYRKALMSSAGSHMKASAMIMKGKIDRQGDLTAHAQSLYDISLVFAQLFPEGTGPDAVKSTEAKPEVWTKREEFDVANRALTDAAKALREAAALGDEAKIKEAFGAVGKSCGGCHDNFRVDD